MENNKDVYCNGLQDGFAKRQSDNATISIHIASKEDGELYCPKCYSSVHFRRCTDKVDHFYHIARQSDMEFSRESALHKKCKNILCDILKKAYPNGKWETERKINSINSIPDISGRINGQRLVIEIQKSSITPKTIIERTEKYTSARLTVLWIVPLLNPLGKENFRPRMIERFFHEMYGGKCFYWDDTNPSFIYPVHYSRAFRYIETSEFYDEDGQHQEFGGYNKAYKTIKVPNYGKALSITNNFEIEYIDSQRYFNTETFLPKAYIYKPVQSPWWDVSDNSISDSLLEDRLHQLNKEVLIKFGKYKLSNLFDMLGDLSYCQWFKENIKADERNKKIIEAISVFQKLSTESELYKEVLKIR